MTAIDCYGPIELVKYFFTNSSDPLCQEIFSTQAFFSLPPVWIYILLFSLTNLLEFPVYKYFLKREKILVVIKHVLAVNITTHPVVVFIFPYIAEKLVLPVSTSLTASEAFAVAVESILMGRFLKSYPKGALAALLANLFSWGVGLQIVKFIL